MHGRGAAIVDSQQPVDVVVTACAPVPAHVPVPAPSTTTATSAAIASALIASLLISPPNQRIA